jgi:hypothetical protein
VENPRWCGYRDQSRTPGLLAKKPNVEESEVNAMDKKRKWELAKKHMNAAERAEKKIATIRKTLPYLPDPDFQHAKAKIKELNQKSYKSRVLADKAFKRK